MWIFVYIFKKKQQHEESEKNNDTQLNDIRQQQLRRITDYIIIIIIRSIESYICCECERQLYIFEFRCRRRGRRFFCIRVYVYFCISSIFILIFVVVCHVLLIITAMLCLYIYAECVYERARARRWP